VIRQYFNHYLGLIVEYVIPFLHHSSSSFSSNEEGSSDSFLSQFLLSLLTYCKEIFYFSVSHPEKNTILTSLQENRSKGSFGSLSLIHQNTNEMNALENLSFSSSFNGTTGNTTSSDNHHLFFNELLFVLEILRILEKEFSLNLNLLELVYFAFFEEMERNMIFTEVTLFLKQFPELQYFTLQSGSNLSSSRKPIASSASSSSSSSSSKDLQIIPSFLPLKELFFSRIQSFKATLSTLLPSSSSSAGQGGGVATTDLLSDDHDHNKKESRKKNSSRRRSRGSSFVASGTSSSSILLLSRFSEEYLLDYVSSYYSSFGNLDYFNNSYLQSIFQNHNILFLLVNYINTMFFQNMEFKDKKQASSSIDNGGGGGNHTTTERKKSRSNSLLLDFDMITITEAPSAVSHNNDTQGEVERRGSVDLLAPPAPTASLLSFEERKTDNKPIIFFERALMKDDFSHFPINHSYFSIGLFTRKADHLKINSSAASHSDADKSAPSSGPSVGSFYYHSVDYYGIIYDIISSYLPTIVYPLSSTSDSSSLALPGSSLLIPDETSESKSEKDQWLSSLLSSEEIYNEILFAENEIPFCQLSGSNDILTVLFAILSINSITKQLKCKIKIINSSNFKIPFFKIHCLLNGMNTLTSSSSSSISFFSSDLSPLTSTGSPSISSSFSIFPSEHLHMTSENMGIAISFPSSFFKEIFGAEYFPINALIEREITFQYSFFSSFDMIIRIEYPDLARNYDLFYGFVSPSSSSSASSTDSSSDLPNARQRSSSVSSSANKGNNNRKKKGNNYNVIPNYLDNLGVSSLPSSANNQKDSQKWNAVIDMSPHHISVTYLIRSYGNNQFSSLSSWKNQHLLSSRSSFSPVRSSIFLFPIHKLLTRNQIKQRIRKYIPSIAIKDMTLPWIIFENQYQRLTERYSHSLEVLYLSSSASPSTSIFECLSHIQQNLYFVNGNSFSGGNDGGVACFGINCVAIHPHFLGLGWSLQTLWNDEITVLLTFNNSISSFLNKEEESKKVQTYEEEEDQEEEDQEELFHEFKGKLQIRCRNAHILIAILNDLEDFVRALSAGFVVPFVHAY
jgi:hypothetical protein